MWKLILPCIPVLGFFVDLVKRHPFCKRTISQNFFPKLSFRTQFICFWHFNRCLPFYIFQISHYLLSFLFSFARLKGSDHMDRVLIIFLLISDLILCFIQQIPNNFFISNGYLYWNKYFSFSGCGEKILNNILSLCIDLNWFWILAQ